MTTIARATLSARKRRTLRGLLALVLACALVGAASPVLADCGDGIVTAGETCDDGNLVLSDGCSQLCLVEGGWTCSGEPSVCDGICGDGFTIGTEACDDHNTDSGDGCSSSCTIEPNYVCQRGVCVWLCGNGLLGETEVCDDGARVDGDGCGANCQVESGWRCTGEPSGCALYGDFSLHAVRDTFLRGSTPNRNEGSNDVLLLRPAPGTSRALLGFDLGNVDPAIVTRAHLVLTIEQNLGGWTGAGRPVDVHPVVVPFREGDGRNFRSGILRTKGSGVGATWRCARDRAIENATTDCTEKWNGGTFGPASDSILLDDADTGEVTFDVTDDVVAGVSSWIVKKKDETVGGRVTFHSHEGAAGLMNEDLAPRLDLVACVPSPELCNGVDDDCDFLLDADDPDLQITAVCEKQDGVCYQSIKTAALCTGGTWDTCTAAEYTAASESYEETETTLDDLDNDCDGATDEGLLAFDCEAAGGTIVVGQSGCWFLGAYGQSCDAVCDDEMLAYSNVTMDVAGSRGTAAACVATLSALGATPPALCDGTPKAVVAPGAQGTAVGCVAQDRVIQNGDVCDADPANTDRYLWFHISFPETTSSAAFSHMQRACACRPAPVM